jgi:HEPN domain-containing protein
MTPNLFLSDETRAWLLRAAEDLAAAAALTAPATLRSALFHCQQAAEQSLNAILTWHQRPFPRTHSLTVLSGLCAELDASLDAALAPSVALTRFAVAMR